MSDEYNNEIEETNEEMNLEAGEYAITATDTESKRKATIRYNLGKDLADAAEKFTEALVYNFFVRYAKVNAQNAIRALLKAGKTEDEIAEYMAENWTPGATIRDPQAAAIKAFESMSADDRAAFIAALQAKLND